MGKRSKEKGAAFERRICKILGDAYGIELRRTPLSGGWAQHYDDVAGDVVAVKGTFPYCVECKKEEGWKLESLLTDSHAWFDAWWMQTVNACPSGQVPLLIFSRNYMPVFAASNCEDLLSDLRYGNIDVSYAIIEDIAIMLLDNFIAWDKEEL